MTRPVTFLCAMALLAGCGGDDSGASGGGGDEMTQAEFSAEGKRICQDGADRAQRTAQEEMAKPEVQKMAERERQLHILRVSMKEVDRTMDEIEALEPPETTRPHVERLTKGVREVMDLTENIERADSDTVTRLAELAAQTRDAAKQAGLEACLPENTA